MNSKRIIEVSKFLSFVLRHSPEAIGLNLDSEGWATVDELLTRAKQNGQDVDISLLRAVVDGNDKKRFSLSPDGMQIRAVQGHSASAVNLQHVEKVPPAVLYHGTATRFITSILEKGLIPGERQHVHLSENRETAKEVGKRYGVPVILKVNAKEMHGQGAKFFQAENGVWLTGSVPATFIDTSLR